MYVSKPRLSMDSSYEILDIAQQLSDLFVESLSTPLNAKLAFSSPH